MNDLETLRDSLDIALLRIESGQSLVQALADAPRFKCEKQWIERWLELKSRLIKGEASAAEALSNFRRSVDLQLRIHRLVARRSLLPLVQACAVGLTSILFLVATQTLFADMLKLRASELMLVISLLGLGYFWIFKLMQAYRRDLWFIDWLEFVSGIATRVSWGQSLLVAWKQSLPLKSRLPAELDAFLKKSLNHAENYEALPRISPTGKRDLKLIRKCQLRWEQIHRLFIANERVLPVLQKELTHAYEHFQDGLERKAELLSAKMMLPLFLCFAPAYLLMLLAPLIRPLMAPMP